VTPLVELRDLIKERVGAEPGQATVYFRMNPKVDDIPERFSVEKEGVKLLVMGTIRRGGNGCACPEHALVRQLLSHLMVQRDEVVIMDMEAGIEHLGRGTAQFVDVLLVVVEPTAASLQTLSRIRKLAQDLRIKRVAVVANKVKDNTDIVRVTAEATDDLWCTLPYSAELTDYDTSDSDTAMTTEIRKLGMKLTEELAHGN
jgi:CO dehydrogenase maturation factor